MRRFAACLIVSFVATAIPGGLALAASNGRANYVGKTTQHKKIRVRANSKRLWLKSFAIKLNCRDGSTLVDQESGFEPSPLRHGQFKDTQYGSTDTVVYSGRVRGSKVTGILRVRDRVGKVRCASPKVKFTARRHG